MKKYNIIYADPPWQYTSKSVSPNREVTNHYSTMSIDQIKKIPIKDISEKDSVLFLWVTFPCLTEGVEVLKEWGFQYKTCAFNWIKQNKKSDSLFMGLGSYTRANSEICLLGIKGKPKIKSHSVRQVVLSPIEQHSKKPDEVRKRIVELLGDLPRVELFARQKADGWDSWGNEVDNDVEIIGG